MIVLIQDLFFVVIMLKSIIVGKPLIHKSERKKTKTSIKKPIKAIIITTGRTM